MANNNIQNLQNKPPDKPEKQSTAKRKSELLRLFGLAWEFRKRCAYALFWSILIQALALAGYMYSGLALDVLRYGHGIQKNTSDGAVATTTAVSHPNLTAPHWPFGLEPDHIFSQHDWSLTDKVALAAGIVLGLTLLRAIGHYMARVTDETLIQVIIVKLRTSMYTKLQQMSFSYFDKQDTGGLINRVTGDAQSVREFIQGIVVRLIVASASLAIFLTYMLKAHWGLTLALLCIIPLQSLAIWRYARLVRPRFKAMREAIDRLIQTLQESVIGVKVVKGFGRESEMINKFDKRNQDALNARLQIASVMSKYMPFIPCSAYLQLAILLAYGGYLVKIGPAAGGITIGTLWVFLSLLRRLAEQVDAMIQSAAVLPDALTGAERVFELLDGEPAITTKQNAYNPEKIAGHITFENVSFGYDYTNDQKTEIRFILEDISLDIKAGEIVAIVGPAGSGKTTLFHLISRFYDTNQGRILIDGVELRDWNLELLRKSVGVVFQEPYLFSNSIAINVSYGKPDIEYDIVRQALEDVSAIDFVEDSVAGFNTQIGERGITLSGGERQRLSLARAILISPPILLLDDATASVDAKTEMQIQRSLDRIMQGRTTLIIAHRLSTLRRADRIVVLERGRITAVGTHEDLIRKNVHYRRSAELQLERELAHTTDSNPPDYNKIIETRSNLN